MPNFHSNCHSDTAWKVRAVMLTINDASAWLQRLVKLLALVLYFAALSALYALPALCDGQEIVADASTWLQLQIDDRKTPIVFEPNTEYQFRRPVKIHRSGNRIHRPEFAQHWIWNANTIIRAVGKPGEWKSGDSMFYWNADDDQLGIRNQGHVVECHGAQVVRLPQVENTVFMRAVPAQDPGTENRDDYLSLARNASQFFVSQRFSIHFGGPGWPRFEGDGRWNPAVFDFKGSVYRSVFENIQGDCRLDPAGKWDPLLFRCDDRGFGGGDYTGMQSCIVRNCVSGAFRGGHAMFYGRANHTLFENVSSNGRTSPDFYIVNSTGPTFDGVHCEGASAAASILLENVVGFTARNTAIGHSVGKPQYGEQYAIGHNGVVMRNVKDSTIYDRPKGRGTKGWAWRREKGLVDGYAVTMDRDCDNVHLLNWATHQKLRDSDVREEFDIDDAHDCSISGREMNYGKRYKVESKG